MANKKMTKREKFEMLMAIPAVAENTLLTEFINHELDLLAKKNSGEKKPTANQTLNEAIKKEILEYLSDGEGHTITDLVKNVPNLPENMSGQRMSALVRQLKEAEIVERYEVKRVAYFKIKE